MENLLKLSDLTLIIMLAFMQIANTLFGYTQALINKNIDYGRLILKSLEKVLVLSFAVMIYIVSKFDNIREVEIVILAVLNMIQFKSAAKHWLPIEELKNALGIKKGDK